MASFRRYPYSVSYPPLDGSLYLPEMVEFNAMHNPMRSFYTFYDPDTDVLRTISHLEFYRASQRVAHAVRPGRCGPDKAVIAIIANSDTILYHALTMGIIYAGHIPFPMSPRNSSAAVVNMLRKTGCRRVIATRHSLEPLLDAVRAESESSIEIEDPPALAYAYPELGHERPNTPFVPYPKAAERPVDDAVMYYLHSSGSTGFPKPIPITFLTAVHWCITPSVLEHVDYPTDIRVGAPSLPPFHTLGMYVQLYYPIAALVPVCVYAPTSYRDPTVPAVFPNPHNTIEVVKKARATALVVVPAFLEAWASEGETVRALSRMEYVYFAGGPLSKKTGDALVSAGVRLASVWGTTEVCALTYAFRAPDERALWEWIRFGPNQRIRWVAQGDGTYECQVLTCPTHQVSVENIPDVKGYATQDAFVKHPTVEGLYKHVGRLDDVLVLASGEKSVPAPIETVIGSSQHVSGVCVFGRGRNQVGVLIEPRGDGIDVQDEVQAAAFRNLIWPDVEEANKEAPAFCRIFKEMILVTHADKPMIRAGKGTVIKKATMALYEAEIDTLYASVEASAKAGSDVPLPSTWSQPLVEAWLAVHATALNAGKPIQATVDLFEQGFDSLSATFLKNRIIGACAESSHATTRAAASRINQNVVFANPTLRQLAGYLVRLVAGNDENASLMGASKAEIEDMIRKYAIRPGDAVAGDVDKSASHRGHVVLLTGSTGGLGSYLLASLLTREDVALVYAFNRPSKTGTKTIQQRQCAAFEDRGLDTDQLALSKLVYLEGDAAQPNLSLDDQTYGRIRDEVTVIIHNAWRLDFNLALSSFEPNIRGTRHLIDLARGSNRPAKPRFLFTSSISSAQGWDKRRGVFPEEIQLDAGVAVGYGYGASKYVSERVLATSGLPATSFRIGQITGGAPRGAWSATDWVPILVKSSVTLGVLPEARGVTSWLPPQAVSDAILEVAFADEAPPAVVNVVHPRPIAWDGVMQAINDAMYEKGVTPTRLGLVPMSEWVERLEGHATDTSERNMGRVPAIRLVNFMRLLAEGDTVSRTPGQGQGQGYAEAGGFTSFATEVARRVSRTMRTVEAISAVDAASWVDYWVSGGMFAGGGVR